MIAENHFDLGLKMVTISSKRHGDRIFVRVRAGEPYTKRDGTLTKVDVWRGSCVVCGGAFEVRTARTTSQSKVFQTTTCITHRKRSTGDLSPRTVTIASKLHGERVFHRIRCNEPYTRRDGTVTKLDVWIGSCVVCGDPFEVRTGRATSRSKAFQTTTCVTHRRGTARLMNGNHHAAGLHADVAHNAEPEPEEEPSLLHELPTPHWSTLPVITEDALKIKRHERFEKIKADRDSLKARPAPNPAVLHIKNEPPPTEALDPTNERAAHTHEQSQRNFSVAIEAPPPSKTPAPSAVIDTGHRSLLMSPLDMRNAAGPSFRATRAARSH